MVGVPSPGRRRWEVLLVFAACVGAALFARGFLQVRRLVEDRSTGTPPVEPAFFPATDGGWLPVRPTGRRKLILLIIDALRIDFVLPSREDADRSIAWYDKLTVLSELTRSEPARAKLFHFVADPPTATTQRLSGIAAGTLPAFVEVASNFAGSSLGSDNFVHQLLQCPRYQRLDVYGDDTWLHLFPAISEQSRGRVAGYHSFHLFDLHTVDTAVKGHLFPALEGDDHFDAIIAHFLGVDHCGHKHGPKMAPCGEKLAEMDDVIRRVIDGMDGQTTLLVLGDHGMTDEGDHGGISPKEVGSALFYYDKGAVGGRVADDEAFWKAFFARVDRARGRLLNVEERPFYAETNDVTPLAGSLTQIDLTPTISLLLGIPIPFGNVGSIIPETLVDYSIYATMSTADARRENLKRLVEAIRMNSHQVRRFLDRSTQLGEGSFDAHSLAPLHAKLAAAEAQLRDIKATAGELTEEGLIAAFEGYHDFLLSTQQYCRAVWADFNIPAIAFGLIMGTLAVLVLLGSIAWTSRSASSLCSLALAIFHTVSLSATSFITFEDSVVRFLLTSLVMQSLLASFFRGSLSTRQALRGLALMLLLRLTSYTGGCREEQFPYCQTITHRSVIWQEQWTVSFLASASVGLLGLLWVLRQCHCSLREIRESALSLIGHAAYFCIVTLLGTHWMWTWMADTSESKQDDALVTSEIMAVIIPRALFILCGLSSVLFRRNSALLLIAVTALVGIVLRPFAGWALLVGGLGILQLGSAMFAASDAVSAAVFFYLAGMHLFFITGHQTTLTNLQWEAAFVGFRSTIQAIAATLMALNTFGGPMLAVLTLCLCCSPEVALVYIWYSLAQLIAAAGFTTALMRHLMVWKMFTPRFLFQACSCLTALIVIFLMHFAQTTKSPATGSIK